MATDFKLKVGLDVPASSDYIKQTDLPELQRKLNQDIQPHIHLKMGFDTDKTKLQSAVNVLAKSLPVVPVKVELDVPGLKAQIATVTQLLQNTNLGSLSGKKHEYKIDASLTSSEKMATAQAEVERLRMSFERLGNMSDETRQMLTELANSADAAAKAGDFKEATNGIRLLKTEVESLLKNTKYNANFSDVYDEYKNLGALLKNMGTGAPEKAKQTVVEISDQLAKISTRGDMDLLSEEELNQLIRARTLIYDLKQTVGAVDLDNMKIPDLQKVELQISSIKASLHKLGANDSGVTQSISDLTKNLEILQEATKRGLLNPNEAEIALKLRGEVEQLVKQWKELKLQSGNDFFDASMLRRFEEAQNKLKSFVHEYKKVLTDPALKMEYDRLTDIQIGDIKNKGNLESYLRQMNNFTTAADLAGKKVHTLDQRLRTMLENFSVISVITGSMYMLEQAFESAVQNVRNLDKAMTELRKVSDLSASEYAGAMETAKQSAMELGTTVSDMLNSTSDFMRLGHSLADSEMLARAANVYFSVADGIENIDDATSVLISTMQAFNMEAEESMLLADKLNELGNTTPASARDLGEALKRSSAAMAAANTDLDKTLGLIVAAQATVQNAEVVGTALKTLSMRVRGAKVELEEAGLETDNMATSTAKLREEVLALTHSKVDIMIDDETFKDIFVILQEISHEWDNINDVSQAALLNLLGGQRQANVLAAIIENFELAEEAAQTSMGAAGSAMKENEKQIQSLEGRITLFKAALESLSETLLDSEGLKSIVDMGTGAIETLDKLVQSIGGVGTAIAALSGVGAYIALDSLPADVKTGEGLKDLFSNIDMELDFTGRKKTAKVQSDMMNTLADDADALQDFWDAFAGSDKNLNRANDAMKKMSESARSLAESLKESGKAYDSGCNDITEYVEIQVESIESIEASTVASKAASIGMNLLASATISVGAALASWAINQGIEYLREITVTASEAKERFAELSDELNVAVGNQDDFESLANELDALKKKTSLTAEETERYYEIQNQLKDLLPSLEGYYNAQGNFIISEKDNVQDLIDAYDGLINTKRRAAESAYMDKTWWGFGKSAYESDQADVATAETNIQKLDEYISWRENKQKPTWATDHSEADLAEYFALLENELDVTTVNEAIAKQKEYNQTLREFATSVVGHAQNAVMNLDSFLVDTNQNADALNFALNAAKREDAQDWYERAYAYDENVYGEITSSVPYQEYVAGAYDQFSDAQAIAIAKLGGLKQAEIKTAEYAKHAAEIDKGTFTEWNDVLLESEAHLLKVADAALHVQDAVNNTSLEPLSLEESQKGLVEDMNTLEESVKALGEAYSEFAEDGEITASTLASLSETFSGCGDEWTDFVSLVGSGNMTLSDLDSALEDLLSKYVQQKALTGDVTEETKNLLVEMLKTIGITNAEEVAMNALGSSLAELKAEKIAASTPNFYEMSADEIVKLLDEEQASKEVAAQLYNLYLAKIQASNGGFLAITKEEVSALQALTTAAGNAAEALPIFNQLNAAIDEYNGLLEEQAMGGMITEAMIEEARNEMLALQDSVSQLGQVSENTADHVEADFNKISGAAEKTADKISDAFQEAYDELQFMREANLISEEQYLAQLFALNEKYNKNNLQMYRKYALEIFNTMKSLIADQINKQADAEIKALEEQREATEKYYDERIEALEKEREAKEKYYDELIEAEQDRLDQLKDEWTVQDHLLKIEQARAALKAAQEQKTVHLYKEGEGFIWEADQEEVGNANDALNEAIKDYERYIEEKEIQDRIDMLEDAKEQVLDMIDEQIKHLEEAKEQALEMIDEQIKAVEEWRDSALEALEDMEMSTEAFLEFFKQFGLEMTAEIDALIAKLDELAAAFARLAAARAAGYGGGGDWEDDTSSSKKSGVTYTTSSKITGSETKGNVATKYDSSGKKYTISTTTSTVTTTTTGSDGSVKTSTHTNRYYDADDGATQISGRYAEGTLSVPTTGMALTDEKGPEIRIPGKGTFRKLHYGDAVLPADISRNLWMIGAKPVSFAKGIANMISNKSDDNRQSVFNFGDIHLPNVQNAQDFANEFKDIVMKATQLAYSK